MINLFTRKILNISLLRGRGFLLFRVWNCRSLKIQWTEVGFERLVPGRFQCQWIFKKGRCRCRCRLKSYFWCQLKAPAPAPQAPAVRGFGHSHGPMTNTWCKIRRNYNREDLANSNLAPLTINLRKSNLAKPIQTWPAYQAKNLKWSGLIWPYRKEGAPFRSLICPLFFRTPSFF